MPDLTTYGRDPYPTGAEAAWVPGSFMAYAEAVDAKHVHTVASLAARDAQFAALPAGYVVTCAPLKTVWLSLGGGAWETLYTDTGWQLIASTAFGPNFSGNAASKWRQVGKVVDVYLAAAYNGADLTDADGNIADMVLATLPAPPPVGGFVVGNTWASAPLFYLVNTTGLVTITHMMAGGTLLSASAIYFHCSYTV